MFTFSLKIGKIMTVGGRHGKKYAGHPNFIFSWVPSWKDMKRNHQSTRILTAIAAKNLPGAVGGTVDSKIEITIIRA